MFSAGKRISPLQKVKNATDAQINTINLLATY